MTRAELAKIREKFLATKELTLDEFEKVASAIRFCEEGYEYDTMVLKIPDAPDVRLVVWR